MKLFALTGNMGSGKTTVAQFFGALGCKILYSDQLARKSIENIEILKNLIQTFGKEILNQDQTLNRQKLGNIAFSSKDSLQKLNYIIHPKIRVLFWKEMEKIYQEESKSLVIYEVPLLFESNLQNNFQKIILVYSDINLMLERKSLQTGLSKEQINQRLNHQYPIEKKLQFSDYLIENNGELVWVKNRVQSIFKQMQAVKNLDLDSIKKKFFNL